MNAVEIEEAVSDLAAQPFDAAEFPFQFLAAFGNKETTLKRLKSGSSNASDVPAGVLQRNNIHIATAAEGEVSATLTALRASPKTASSKAKFILATDGIAVEAEYVLTGEVMACEFVDLANHFGFYLPLAGITTVKEIKNNPIDVKATGRLNKLYVELLRDNPDWATEARRHELNQFMARLIFCFFAEDTGIFGAQQFTDTLKQMSDGQSANTHEVLGELFRAMDTKIDERRAQAIASWAGKFPFVNGGLFTGGFDCPRFSRIARSYLLRAGELNWKEINPDIFGSMIQAVADDEERGELGTHYTSVPNILKVLNPLFLDDLREQLAAAAENARKLRTLRKRLSAIRVFDPACGSGNFLVIAYKQMRAIEAEIVRRLGDEERPSVIPLSNFFGIEIKGFAAEIARLALLIAEFQADCLYLSQQEARAMVLPLHHTGRIHVGNALRLDWRTVCPPPSRNVAIRRESAAQLGVGSDIADSTAPETYICGNPPYAGLSSQTSGQKADLASLFDDVSAYWKSFDYVAGWLYKARLYSDDAAADFAFVMTNSVCQGQQVPMIWPLIIGDGHYIRFAHTSFKWSNLAARKAAVTVVIVGISNRDGAESRLILTEENGESRRRSTPHINAYLAPYADVFVTPLSSPLDRRAPMYWGCKPVDDGNLIVDRDERDKLIARDERAQLYLRPYFGSTEFIESNPRYCVWVSDEQEREARLVADFSDRFERVRAFRANSKAAETRPAARFPHRFRQIQGRPGASALIVPIHSSESRQWLPVGRLPEGAIVSNAAFAAYDSDPSTMAILVSRMHSVWIATVCGKIKTDFRYSNTLGWNTFPIPTLTAQNRADLERSAENILIAREVHFPSTIAELYDPDEMPENLRRAHEANDDVLERIYVGRGFRNDTERLEKLFDLYSKMSVSNSSTNYEFHMGTAGTA